VGRADSRAVPPVPALLHRRESGENGATVARTARRDGALTPCAPCAAGRGTLGP